MKQKILDIIKTKFPTAKLSAKRLDAIAASIEAKAGTDETAIEGHLDALNELYPLTEIAKDDHIRSTLEGKLKATQKKDDKTDPTAPTETVPDDAPDWAKTLLEQNKTLAQTLAAIQGEKVMTGIRGKLEKELLKDIPVSYWGKRAIPDKEEGLEAFVNEVTADYTAFKQEMSDKGLGFLSKPAGGNGGGGSDKAIDPTIKAFAEKQLVAKPAATT